jgi:UDP-N-acetylglucosamine diphosphorylase / glucose-1-phosphate thymidylyltransferase / UDP-N-acetylgalactosamine diphosphorylase / glucosamine-1-phosphate N-acetyltransferase / galactosamine-1-phosphate N-acetyltransferase
VHARDPLKASDFFALPESLASFRPFFGADVAPWEWLKQIGPALAACTFDAEPPRVPPGVHVEGPVHIGADVRLPAHATIIGPAWIGAGTQIRPGAYIRENVITGEGCILGNSSEFKNCLLMDGVQAPHFNYVGDSVLGNRAHLGAGAICSNLRLDQKKVILQLAQGAVDTGLRKFGAIIGDNAEVGCNAVLNPGTLLGPRSLVMPAIAFGGVLPPATIARVRQQVTLVPRRF